MANFSKTFGEGTIVQPVANETASRFFGGAMKLASLTTLGTIAIAGTPLTAPIIGVAALAAATYGLGAAAQAFGMKSSNLGTTTLRNLNPLKL